VTRKNKTNSTTKKKKTQGKKRGKCRISWAWEQDCNKRIRRPEKQGGRTYVAMDRAKVSEKIRGRSTKIKWGPKHDSEKNRGESKGV